MMQIPLLQTAIRLNPNYFSAYHCKGNIHNVRGLYEMDVGLDPTDSLDSAVEMLKKAIKINPGYFNAYISLGFAAVSKGEYLSLVGHNPNDTLNLAEETFQNAMQINPNFHELFRGLAQSNWKRAEFCVEHKTDPTLYLKQARSFIQKAFEADKSSRVIYSLWGEIELIAARWKMLQQSNPETELQRAIEWENRGLNIGPTPKFFDAWYSQARVYHRWAEWNLVNKRNADRELRLGLDMVSSALKIKPRSAEMIATRGIFFLFQARSASNVSQRKAFADKAQMTIQEALKLNANLTRLYTPYLKEAESLVQ